jgi:phage repressor protein C with HTH and peptisase S24 domain
MLSHSRIWAAIDALAARHGLSPSGLARRAGLDPTTFNRSKRVTGQGRQRWPSTESIAKILGATGVEMADFVRLMREEPPPASGQSLPVIGFVQAGTGGYPETQLLDEVEFPGVPGETAFALRLKGDSMLPLYRNGDTLVVSRSVPCRTGDRVVVKTRGGEVMAKVLQRQTAQAVDLMSLNPEHGNRTLAVADVEWMGRIIWASQ